MAKIIYSIIATLALGLGIVGIFLPILPTTPFLLLAAALYYRSSPKLYDWLLTHKHLGPYIQNFRIHRAIPLHVKIVSISMVWGTLLYCAFGVAEHWLLRTFFLLLAAGISIHILSYKTMKK